MASSSAEVQRPFRRTGSPAAESPGQVRPIVSIRKIRASGTEPGEHHRLPFWREPVQPLTIRQPARRDHRDTCARDTGTHMTQFDIVIGDLVGFLFGPGHSGSCSLRYAPRHDRRQRPRYNRSFHLSWCSFFFCLAIVTSQNGEMGGNRA